VKFLKKTGTRGSLISKLLKEPRTKGFQQNQRTAQQTPAVVRAVLGCQNHGSRKSKNQS